MKTSTAALFITVLIALTALNYHIATRTPKTSRLAMLARDSLGLIGDAAPDDSELLTMLVNIRNLCRSEKSQLAIARARRAVLEDMRVRERLLALKSEHGDWDMEELNAEISFLWWLRSALHDYAGAQIRIARDTISKER